MKKLLTPFAFALLILLLSGCENPNDGMAENAGEKIDQAVEEGRDAVEDAADEVGERIEEAGDAIRDKTDK